MENLTVDWKDSKLEGDEIVTSPTFANCTFVAVGHGMQYSVFAENVDGTKQPICITDSACGYMNHAIAITIAEALRLYYARLQ